MRKIILNLALSLDGYIEGPNGEVDWLSFTDETAEALESFIDQIDTILYGRTSYELYGNYNPPDSSAEFEKEFYRKTSVMNRFVFSTTKSDFEGNPTVVKSGIAEKMKKLKEQPGKDIWLYGGSNLVTTFINENLIDEYRLAVVPIVLGAGNPLFKNLEHRVKLNLLKAKTYKSGMLELWYSTAAE